MRTLLLILAAALSAGAAQAQLPEPVAQSLRTAGIPENAVAFWTQALQDGRQQSHRSSAMLNTASVMKLLTSYAALDLLGPAYSWKTEALTNGPIRNGTLQGALILRGGGDPFLTWDRFGMLVRELRERGLRRIEGGLLLDRSAFATQSPEDFDGKPARAYNAQPDAMMVNFNAITLRLQPTQQGVSATATLPVAGLRIENRLALQANAPCTGWKNAVAARIEQNGETLQVTLPGRFPANCGEKLLNLAAPDPARFTGSVFRALWQELGGSFSGPVSEGPAPASAALLASWSSPPLAEILRNQNKYSNNVMARHIFLTLAAGNGHSASPENSIARIQAWMPGHGLDPTQWTLENGSGLSRQERTNAAQLGALLLDAWRSPRMPDFVASLPILGIDGTLQQRLTDTPLQGRGYIKTGSLDGVKAAAGYLLDAKGQWCAFVWMVNHPKAELSDPALDALLRHLYQGSP
jgi:D-alanyl-D-alanine carboxypeptidase/D-alanyl-D-alanine-endopeptidase (penicillin-binding protein 4)